MYPVSESWPAQLQQGLQAAYWRKEHTGRSVYHSYFVHQEQIKKIRYIGLLRGSQNHRGCCCYTSEDLCTTMKSAPAAQLLCPRSAMHRIVHVSSPSCTIGPSWHRCTARYTASQIHRTRLAFSFHRLFFRAADLASKNRIFNIIYLPKFCLVFFHLKTMVNISRPITATRIPPRKKLNVWSDGVHVSL